MLSPEESELLQRERRLEMHHQLPSAEETNLEAPFEFIADKKNKSKKEREKSNSDFLCSNKLQKYSCVFYMNSPILNKNYELRER